jgi:hypothetical protein
MKEVKCKLYKFDELSEESQKVVMNRERDSIQQNAIDAWESEHRETLKEFSDIFEIDVRNWEVSSYGHDFSFRFRHDVYERDADDVSGKLLLRFLNSIYYEVRSRKYFSCGHRWENGKFHFSSRKSKILWEEMNCPLTGVCYDCDILKPIYDWHKKPDWGKSLSDLVYDCLENFFSSWEDECYSFGSDEYVSQELMESSVYENVLYFEDGTEFKGIYEDVA